MATTKVDKYRLPYQALERYTDAVIITDNNPLYFGNDGDTKVQFNSTDTKTVVSKADIRFSDTTNLGFGDADDATITWDGTGVALGGNWTIRSNDIKLSDTVQFQVGNSADLTLTHDGTNTLITNATGYIGVSGAGADIRLSDSVQLIFGSTASSDCRLHYNNQTGSDCLILTKGTSGLVKRATKSGCVFASDGFLKIVS
jgi:hypothetical protein